MIILSKNKSLKIALIDHLIDLKDLVNGMKSQDMWLVRMYFVK